MLTPTILFQSILFRGLLRRAARARQASRAATRPVAHVSRRARARANAPTGDRTGGRARERPRSTGVRPTPCPWSRERRHARCDMRRTLGGSPFASSGLSPDTDDTQHRTRSIARIGPETGPASPRESPHTPDAARGHPYAPGMPTVYGETLLSGLSGSEANLVSVAMFAMDRQWIRLVTVTGSRFDRRSAIVPGRMVGSVER